MKYLQLSFVLWLLLLGSSHLLSQTLDEIIANHLDMIGGMEKIQAIQTLKITGVVARGRGDRVFESEFTRYFKAPNLVRNETEMRGMTLIQAFDGQTAWGIMPFRGDNSPQELPKRQARSLMLQTDIGGPLVNYQSRGFTVELMGKEDFEGTEVFKLKITDADSGISYSYLDAEYFIEIKRVNVREGRDGNTLEITMLFSDFKPVDGVLMPHSIVTEGSGFAGRGGRRGGFGKTQMTINSVEVNLELDDNLFKMPAKE